MILWPNKQRTRTRRFFTRTHHILRDWRKSCPVDDRRRFWSISWFCFRHHRLNVTEKIHVPQDARAPCEPIRYDSVTARLWIFGARDASDDRRLVRASAEDSGFPPHTKLHKKKTSRHYTTTHDNHRPPLRCIALDVYVH